MSLAKNTWHHCDAAEPTETTQSHIYFGLEISLTESCVDFGLEISLTESCVHALHNRAFRTNFGDQISKCLLIGDQELRNMTRKLRTDH